MFSMLRILGGVAERPIASVLKSSHLFHRKLSSHPQAILLEDQIEGTRGRCAIGAQLRAWGPGAPGRGRVSRMGSIGRYFFRTGWGAQATICVGVTALTWITHALRDVERVLDKPMARSPAVLPGLATGAIALPFQENG